MLDFVTVSTRSKKSGFTEIYPKFLLRKSEDLMIRGGDFYAVWVEDRGLWSTDEYDVVQLVDRELSRYADENKEKLEGNVKVNYMWDAGSGSIDAWHKYCQKQLRDSFNVLDEKLLFSNDGTDKHDYASKRLSYPLEADDCPAYEKLISTLYTPEERHKLEWAIGSIVSGESKQLQKFLVLYGGPGTGKSTILNIIQDLFDGYHTVFDAKALGSANAQFALEPFKTNPLVAIQHDGDLSRIEDNTRLNSVVSHEWMTVNEKHKAQYNNKFVCFLFMGTNKPVKITDGKSGILRRLIDVSPSGNKVSAREYKKLVKQIKFELGAIAWHCKEVFAADPGYYDEYTPTSMMGASNDFYNYIIDSYSVFKREDGTTLKAAWEMYKTYVDEAKVAYPFNKRNFKEELKNYFDEFIERFTTETGERTSSYYRGFKTDLFDTGESREKKEKKRDGVEKVSAESNSVDSKVSEKKSEEIDIPDWLKMPCKYSVFDTIAANYPAQLASSKETPTQAWDKVRGTLSKIDTSKLHYVKVPENHIVIDFDIKDESGKKNFKLNAQEAKEFPPTYAELSKSGEGIHLHYIYSGDVSKLLRTYSEDVEIKVFTGKSSLRRKLTKCNDLPIATISSGLPLKGDEKLISWEGVKNEKALRTIIKRNLNKEYHGHTGPSVQFIYSELEKAYASGEPYDVSDLKNAVVAFAAQSTNQADKCLRLANDMKFKSEEPREDSGFPEDESPIVFYDIEVFPNLFVVCWKVQGEGTPVVKMINPSPSEIEKLLQFKLVGFNNKDYDNHIIYARLMGYTNEQLYTLSQRIINSKKGDRNSGKFREAFDLSYTDIYDFASAGNKKSLKKLEIEMGIHHDELGLPWDQPVPEELWERVCEYCTNDVVATEAAFNYLKGDWIARQILADITGLPPNTSTNNLSARIIFGNDRKPQGQFNYRNLAEPVHSDRYEEYRHKFGDDYNFRVFNDEGLPEYRDYTPGEVLPKGWSILPFFKGYKYEFGKSTYLGEEIGEGGRVYAEKGCYGNVWDGDVTGQHPSSIIAEVLFGVKYTKAFKEIVDARVSIKHEAWDQIDNLFDGKLKPYIQKVIDGELTSKELANACKTVVNAVYGQTKASYECAFRDVRNKDNLVAKRGALFMTLLKREVQRRGFKVVHLKTDSIKVPDATQEIQDFVLKFGKEFGYGFETEAEFEKYCLVNDAVYIAKFKEPEIDKKTGKEIWWTATGKQFAVPYVFKKLFSHDPITNDDRCETFASTTALYLDMNENLPDVTMWEKLANIRASIMLKGLDKLTKSEVRMLEQYSNMTDDDLALKIAEGHDYKFIGKVGRFCPVKSGCGGGELKAARGEKYNAAPGTTGFRWLESELVLSPGNEHIIDESYYTKLVDDAIATISKYTDFTWFASDDPYTPPPYYDGKPLYYPLDDDVLPWYTDDEVNDMFKKR